jgi:hypothetical protein
MPFERSVTILPPVAGVLTTVEGNGGSWLKSHKQADPPPRLIIDNRIHVAMDEVDFDSLEFPLGRRERRIIL